MHVQKIQTQNKMITTKLNKPFEDLYSNEFQQKITEASNAIVLDVRTPDEFRNGKIPHSINMDIMSSSFIDQIDSLDKSKTYFVYCRSGARSAQACGFMAGKGFRVYNLAGGILNWKGKVI